MFRFTPRNTTTMADLGNNKVTSWPIKFTPGARPGQKRKFGETVTESKVNYEINRKDRGFKEVWREGRDWLYHEEGVGMKCKHCIEGSVIPRNQTSNFVCGSKNYRVSTITDHEGSVCHLKATEIFKAKELKAKATPETKSEAEKTLISLNESARKEIENKFRNVHALIKHNRPISDFIWINELDEAKGLSHSVTYNNRAAATLFLEIIGVTVKK